MVNDAIFAEALLSETMGPRLTCDTGGQRTGVKKGNRTGLSGFAGGFRYFIDRAESPRKGERGNFWSDSRFRCGAGVGMMSAAPFLLFGFHETHSFSNAPAACGEFRFAGACVVAFTLGFRVCGGEGVGVGGEWGAV